MGELHLVVNGRWALTRVAPRRQGATVLLPLRSVVEGCGGAVEYLSDRSQQALAILGDTRVEVTAGEAAAVAGDRRTPLPLPPFVVEETLLVPEEALSPLGVLSEFAESASAVICGCVDPRLAGRPIFLDPGHGGQDPGVVGSGGAREADVTLDVARQTARLLRLAGARPTLSRTTDRTLSLVSRVNAAHARRAQVFISIHANSFRDPAVHGTETYFYETWESHKLAAAVQQELVEELRLGDRGVKEAAYYLLREARMPACQSELAFLTNPGDEALAAEPWMRLRMAMALFRATRAFVDSAVARLS